MFIYPEDRASTASVADDVVSARLRGGSQYSPRPAVWPGVTPLGGGSQSFSYVGQTQGVYAAAPVELPQGGFGDVNILNDWQMQREDFLSSQATQLAENLMQVLVNQDQFRAKDEAAAGGMIAPTYWQLFGNRNRTKRIKGGNGKVYLGGEHITIADQTVDHDDVGAPAGAMSDSAPYGDGCQYTVTIGYDDKNHLASVSLVLEES